MQVHFQQVREHIPKKHEIRASGYESCRRTGCEWGRQPEVPAAPQDNGGAAAAAEAAAAAAPREVVPVVARSDAAEFPGLYTLGLLPQPVVGEWQRGTLLRPSFV